MRFHELFVSSTSACFELQNDAPYYAPEPFSVLRNGETCAETVKTNVFSLFDLTPDTEYRVSTSLSDFVLAIRTLPETACLSVRDFGAVGNGAADDTRALATAILACPENGRVLVPAGVYRTGPLALKSCMTLEIAKGATLLGSIDPADYPIWPGEVADTVTGEARQCASWEGEPHASHQAFLSAHHAHDIRVVGEGILDGNAQNGPWWIDHKRQPIGRPRLFFCNGCENVVLHGVTGQNSASWNFHPFFSKNVSFYNTRVFAPADSPNTDGCDPESCDGVNIIGMRFSVGDDAIAIKSGKLYMGAKYKTPASRHTIRNCLMEYAHGGVVLGSEMSGGVRDLSVSQCYFLHTDRGLRIKTRRGRGSDGVIDGVAFSNIRMDNVKTPLVINMFYFCDADGKTEYVWSKEKLPVDERTPYLGRFRFSDMICTDCEYAAGFFYGLPEQPIAGVTIENVSFSFKKDAGSGYPAMMSFIPEHRRKGLIFREVGSVRLKNITLSGVDGAPVTAEHVGTLTEE